MPMMLHLEKLSMYIYKTGSMIYNFVSDKAPSEATFRGAEFLSYDLTQTGGEPFVGTQDAISLYFKTRQPNGLLFYTGTLRLLSFFLPIDI